MAQQSFDPGLTQQFGGKLRRAINKDGSFNVKRAGGDWRNLSLYLYLIRIPWTGFWAWVVLSYLLANTGFAIVYLLIGTQHLAGAETSTAALRFWSAFFFSAHTLTTVGYGNMYPQGIAANFLSAFEAMIGLLGFALATGLLFGRVSKPSARIAFSEKLLIAPYQDKTSLQFRIANRRTNNMMELEAKVVLMTVDPNAPTLARKYQELNLERPSVYFFPLTWTVVHPIDSESPLWGKTADDLKAMQAELLILIKGFDDTFSQVVHARYSYRFDEIVWNAKFAPAFHIDAHGDLILDTHRVSELAKPEPSRIA